MRSNSVQITNKKNFFFQFTVPTHMMCWLRTELCSFCSHWR